MLEAQIKAYYLTLHDDLTVLYYNQDPSPNEVEDKETLQFPKSDFDLLHSQIWDSMRDELITNDYITIPEPDPDTLRAEELLTTSPQAISQPEMWELMRIFGRRLGYRF